MNHKGIIQATLLFTSSLTIMANATIAPSLPAISAHFSDEVYAEVLSKLLLTLPALMIALGSPLAGWVIDHTGRKKLILGSLLLYAFAGSIAAFLDSLLLILISRAFLGIAVAGVMTTSTTLIGDYFTGKERSDFLGKQGAFMALGGVVYITLGGFLADMNWRYPFLIYSGSLIALPFVGMYFFEPEKNNIQHQENENMNNKQFNKLTVFVIYSTAFMGMALFYFIPVQLPYYLKEIMEVNNTLTGLAISVSTMTGAITSLVYQKIRKIIPRFQTLFAFVFTFMSIGYLIIFLSANYLQVLTGMFCTGLGMGIMMPNTNLWLISIAPDAQRGRLIGGVTTAIFTGQFISPLVSQPLQENFSLNGLYGIGSLIMIFLGMAYWIETFIYNKKIKKTRKVKSII